MAAPRYSMTWPMPPPGADAADDREDDVLRRDPGRQRRRRRRRPSSSAAPGGASGWRARARPRWCRCRRPARRTRRGSRCGCRRRRSSCPAGSRPCSGPMTCTMPWFGVAHRVAGDAELGAVGVEHLELAARETGSATGLSMSVVGHVVVGGGDREVGPADASARPAAARRRPGARSPRARGGGRCRAGRARPRPAWTTWASQTFSDRVRGTRPSAQSDRDDLDRQRAARRLVLDGVAGALAEQRLAERERWGRRPAGRPGAPRSSRRRSAACRPRRRPRSGASTTVPAATVPSPSRVVVDDPTAFEQRLELADPGLHLALGVLGGVVVAVLGEVAERPGRLDVPGRSRSGPGWSGPRARPRGGRGFPGSAGRVSAIAGGGVSVTAMPPGRPRDRCGAPAPSAPRLPAPGTARAASTLRG